LALTTTPALLLKGFTGRLGFESHDRRLLILMGALVAILFCAYTIAKVLRDALFLAEFGALALPYAYIGVALAAAGFVWLESIVARRSTRVGATRFNQYAAIGFSIIAAVVLPHAGHWAIAGFYIWTGSQAMMLLPHFWALALDVWDSRRARSVFPLFGGCGLLGGLVGGALAGWSAPLLGQTGLMWMLSGLLVVAHALTRVVEGHRARRPTPIETASTTSRWRIILRSTYIKVLAGALALSVLVSTLIDFQFNFFIQHFYPDPHSLTQFLGRFYVGLNALSLLFQFSVAGWMLHRLGLGRGSALQPITAILFVSGIIFSPIWWIIVAMKWGQGVVFQTLGRSLAEIYYTAIHPRERRLIKPAIDTVVDRWSEAAVGVLLIVLLHAMGFRAEAVAVVTIVLAVVWLVVLFILNRQYGRAFGEILGSRWLEPEVTPEAIRTPSVRNALLQALRAGDERRIVLALKLSQVARDSEFASAVRGCLRHPSPAVRAAAVDSMQAMELSDPEGAIEKFLGEPHEALRRAAVGYLLARSQEPTAFARRLLDGDDVALRQYVLDALFDRPYDAPDALTPEWIEARMKSGSREDLLLASRAAGAMAGGASMPWLRTLLTHPDVEVQRMALLSARRVPNLGLIDVLLPLLLLPELSQEARAAVAAIGDPAVPELERLLGGDQGPRPQSLAARTLGRVGTPRAIEALMKLVRTGDPGLRRLGFLSLNRMRVEGGNPVLPRSTVHKLFLRELADYRVNVEPALRLEGNPAAEVRLFAASFRESAELALERALRALACWYEPKPIAGAFDHLSSRKPQAAAPALEYLGHVLPQAVFRPVTRMFEVKLVDDKPEGATEDRDDVAESIRSAWRSGDGWLRACAIRASRHAPSLDPQLFATGDNDDPVVRAELEALSAAGPRRVDSPPRGAGSASPGGNAC
jgi:AAA family ATP:ADP antiporter